MLKNVQATYELKLFIDNDFTKWLSDTLKNFGVNDKVLLWWTIGNFTVSMNMEEEKISDYNLRDQILDDLEKEARTRFSEITKEYNEKYNTGFTLDFELKTIQILNIKKE